MTESLVSASDAFAGILAARAATDPELRRKAITRTAATVAVAVLHIALFWLLVIAQRIPFVPRAAIPAETILVLTPAEKPASMPRQINANPEKKKERELEYEPHPITLPPVITPPKTDTDVMHALGAELACGASHYEYLNEAARKLCHRPPWKLPPNANLAIAPQPQAPGHLSGADAAARMRAQAPPCAPGTNVPCVDEIIYGKGPH